jgi:hypothetical protein
MSVLKKISSACSAFAPNCQQASRLQSEALDRQLSLSKRLGLRLHLAFCRWCRRYGRQIRYLRQAAHEHDDQLADATPQNLSPAARDRIKQKLKTGA